MATSHRAAQRIGKVNKIAKVSTLGELPAERAASFGKIAVRPEVPGETVDPREAAAMQGVIGTLPERIVWKWLDSKGFMFEVQQAEMGPKFAHGSVVDFKLYDVAAMPVIIRVQGDYFHGPSFPGRQATDDEQAARLRAEGFLVADCWEQDIYDAVEADRLTAYIMGEIGKA